MPIQVNDNETVRELKRIQVNDGGIIRELKKVQINQNGVIKTIFNINNSLFFVDFSVLEGTESDIKDVLFKVTDILTNKPLNKSDLYADGYVDKPKSLTISVLDFITNEPISDVDVTFEPVIEIEEEQYSLDVLAVEEIDNIKYDLDMLVTDLNTGKPITDVNLYFGGYDESREVSETRSLTLKLTDVLSGEPLGFATVDLNPIHLVNDPLYNFDIAVLSKFDNEPRTIDFKLIDYLTGKKLNKTDLYLEEYIDKEKTLKVKIIDYYTNEPIDTVCVGLKEAMPLLIEDSTYGTNYINDKTLFWYDILLQNNQSLTTLTDLSSKGNNAILRNIPLSAYEKEENTLYLDGVQTSNLNQYIETPIKQSKLDEGFTIELVMKNLAAEGSGGYLGDMVLQPIKVSD